MNTNVLYRKIWTKHASTLVANFQDDVVGNVKRGYTGTDVGVRVWTFSSGLMYSLTVFTTIGRSLDEHLAEIFNKRSDEFNSFSRFNQLLLSICQKYYFTFRVWELDSENGDGEIDDDILCFGGDSIDAFIHEQHRTHSRNKLQVHLLQDLPMSETRPELTHQSLITFCPSRRCQVNLSNQKPQIIG